MELKKNNLAEGNPELAKEWHPTMNGDLTPEDVTCGSGRKVWWQCSEHENHKWAATIASRNDGRGCPYCSNQKVLLRYNDLATVNPKLAREWHSGLNGDLTPSDITSGSSKKVWWQCINHTEHQWEAPVSVRKKGIGCPYCSNKMILQGYNDLETTHPELSREWHPTKNNDLTTKNIVVGSAHNVWWKCSENHEWKASVVSRKRGSGCPYCFGRFAIKGETDLATTNPRLKKEWHPTLNGNSTPSDVTCGSSKKVWWQCRKGHEWKTSIESRNRGRGCPICNAETQTSFPEQAIYYYLKHTVPVEVKSRASVFGKELDIYIPLWGIGIEYDGLYFHGHPKRAASENRKNETLSENGIMLIRIKESLEWSCKDQNLIYCVPDSEYNYLKKTLNFLAEILSELKDIHILLDVNIEKDGIEIMEQYVENEKHNSLAVLNPTLAAEWHFIKNGRLTPEQISLGSGKKIWWQCRVHKEHEWKAAPYSRNSGNGCPYCINQKVLLGYNDLATTIPELAIEWHPTKNGDLTPFDVTSGSSKRVWWQCGKGHEWATQINPRSQGHGCPYCSGHRVVKGETDILTTHPEIAREWHPSLNGDLTPSDISAGSNKKVWWQCSEKHEWQSFVYNRKVGKGRCPECTKLANLNAKNN
jgi:DNA-directed RNA polymerase subunit RPC12/RpoP